MVSHLFLLLIRTEPSVDYEMKSATQIIAALRGCTKVRDLEAGKKLHRDAVAARLHTDKYVAATLIRMYSKCRRMALAQQVFDGMIHQEIVIWNSLLEGYVQNGLNSVALDLFSGMKCEPNSITYVTVLKACGSLASQSELQKPLFLEKGISFHKQVKDRGLDSDIFVGSTLVDMYCKSGSMIRAREVFDGMVTKNVVTWTSLILGYVQNGESSVAMDLFTAMDCEPNSVTYVAVLKACGSLGSENEVRKQLHLEKGIAIHKQIRERGFESDMSVVNTLVDMYSKCGSMDRAREVFDKTSSKTAVTWNCLILGYVQNGESMVALDLFTAMDCEPNPITYVAALKACGGLASEDDSQKRFCLEKGFSIHKQIKERKFESDIFVTSTLVDMYSKCGSMDRAKEVFDSMGSKNVVTWTSLIMGYVQNGESLAALDLFTAMDCEPNTVTYVAALKACGGLASTDDSRKSFCLRKAADIHKHVMKRGFDSEVTLLNTLMDMYTKCGCMDQARKVFDRMSLKTVVTWNCLILGYIQNEDSLAAMDLFAAMDCEPNAVTYVAALKACGSLAAVAEGNQIHGTLCKLGLEQDRLVATTLMDLYGKCGGLRKVEELFNNMQSPSVASWNALIAGYSSFGDSAVVFNLMKQMQEAGLKMDAITMVCILTACSRAGLIEKGKLYFDSIPGYGITYSTEHYACMVDMLGRANKLEEALTLVKGMPFEPDSITWMSLLGACRKWCNLEVAKVAFDALAAGESPDSAAYVLMSDIYRSLSMFQEVERMDLARKAAEDWWFESRGAGF